MFNHVRTQTKSIPYVHKRFSEISCTHSTNMLTKNSKLYIWLVLTEKKRWRLNRQLLAERTGTV